MYALELSYISVEFHFLPYLCVGPSKLALKYEVVFAVIPFVGSGHVAELCNEQFDVYVSIKLGWWEPHLSYVYLG